MHIPIKLCLTLLLSKAPVDIAERLMDGSLINYTFTYMRDDGSVYRPTSIVLSSECSDGVCVDMFDTQISSVPPPYTVSVTATNVVGEGNASTSQMIRECYVTIALSCV